MKTLILLIYYIFLSSFSFAQSSMVNVDFEVDGKQLIYKEASVKFIDSRDTVSVNIENGQLLIPASILNRRVTVVFCINKYLLHFDSIPVTLNALSPKWTLGVDKKPFNKEKFLGIKSWKKVQIIYYLKNDDGRTFTVDSGRKSKIILN